MKKMIIFTILSIILIPIVGILGNVLEFSGELMAIMLIFNFILSLILVTISLSNEINSISKKEYIDEKSFYTSKYGDYYDYSDL